MEAILAALALPTWFPPVKIGISYSSEILTSGALSFSNPTKQALDEARRTFGTDAEASIILSLGSGRRRPRSVDTAATNVLDDMAHGGEQIAEELSQRFKNSNFYQRFSVDSGLENLSMTSWTDDDLSAITSHSKAYIERMSSSVSAAAELLMKNKGSITLGQLSEPLILYLNSC
jgi:hypothetical protein